MESTQQGSRRDSVLVARPWVVCFDPDRVDEGWTLRFCPDLRDVPTEEHVEDIPAVASVFALRHPVTRASWRPPLTDITAKNMEVYCQYGKTEEFPADMTLWMRMAPQVSGSEQKQGGGQEGSALLWVGRVSLALQTEGEVVPQLLFVHNVYQVAEQETCEIVVSPGDLLRQSLLPGVFFDPQKRDTETPRLRLTRYRCAVSEWSLILFFYPAGVRRRSPVCCDRAPAENAQVTPQSCEEVWAIATLPERLEKGVTTVVHGGFLLVPPWIGPSELSERIREIVLNESPLFEG